MLLMMLQLLSQTDLQQVYYNISVTGAVDFPGIYHLPPGSRLSEAISLSSNKIPAKLEPSDLKSAGYEINPEKDFKPHDSNQYLFSPDEGFELSLRSIQLKRKGEITYVDLLKFMLLGEDNQNPFLMDGDVIFVPALTRKVEVFGEVVNPGTYEILESDRILDVLKFALGTKESAYLDQVEIIRYDKTQKFTTLTINLDTAFSNPDSQDNIILKNGDQIYIRAIPDFHKYDQVILFGEVKYPGSYVINNNTTLMEILIRAGGITEDADLNNSFLQRTDLEKNYDAEFERLKLLNPDHMTYLEYEYFKTKIRELKGKFAVDFKKITNSEVQEKEIVLQDGDFIYISAKINAVIVSGQVKNPGLVTFLPGKSSDYYIEQAGGFSWKAHTRKIRIIRAESGEWLKPGKDIILEEGDTILIPQKPDWNYWEIFKDTVVVLSQIATLLLVVQNVTSN